MKKIIINKYIDDCQEWDGWTLNEVRTDLDRLEKLGVTHFETQDDGTYLTARSRREETDEEYEVRMKEISKREEMIKRQELKTLKQLKEKYEKITIPPPNPVHVEL